MRKNFLLTLDAGINLILGILLLSAAIIPKTLERFFGVPAIEHAFYPSILGGVFIGITIALLLEANRAANNDSVGLGLGGAVVINLCGGAVLFSWLLFGNLGLPLRGKIFLGL